MTLTFAGDTSDIGPIGNHFFTINTGTLDVDIAGLGSTTVTGPKAVFVFQGSFAGFENTANSVLDTTDDGTFATCDLSTSIGAVTNTSIISNGGASTYATAAGAFEIDSAGASTFTATLTASASPEPASMTLLGLGLLGVAALTRRRR